MVDRLAGHGRYVFPGIRTGERPLSEKTVNAALRGMGYAKEVMTAHGLRATARTIMYEVLGERVDFIEHQLAHMVRIPMVVRTTARAPFSAARDDAALVRLSGSVRVGADVIKVTSAA